VPSNRLLIALAAAIAAIVVAVIVVVRVTGDDVGSSDTGAWADSVCATVADWRSSITSLADVSGALSRETLREKLDDAGEATETLVRKLRDLGAPDTEAGSALEQELDSATDDLESSYENLKAGAEGALDTEGTAAFLRALANLAPDVQGLLTSISTMIESLQSSEVAGDSADEVRKAFEDSERCQELRSEED
jgi:hypothetical protein